MGLQRGTGSQLYRRGILLSGLFYPECVVVYQCAEEERHSGDDTDVRPQKFLN